MTLIVDLDWTAKEMRVHAACALRDRRLDLYKVAWTGRS